ncbi:MAG: FAD-binding oxidoreductase [Pseudomonadota bacterium]
MPITPSLEHLTRLRAITGERTEPVPERYLTEPRDRYQGRAAGVLRPRETAQVAEILALCQRERIGVIPWSGGTGLVGGQVAAEGPPAVVLSLERLNRIRAIEPDDDAIVVEAGVALERVQQAASEAGRLFPLAMASQGSCCIGGNLATNAGGVQVLRYGNARDLVLGIEAVLPDGSIHHGLKRLRKDNTGYDLRHLLIGAEGTLGIITAAVLKLFPAPGETATAMLAVHSPQAALDLLQVMREAIEGITAFELIADCGPTFLSSVYPDWQDPLETNPPWRVLVEATGPAGQGLTARLESALAAAFEHGLASDGVLAQSEAQRQALWWLRETIPEANRKVGSVSSHDISVPKSRIAAFIKAGAAAIAAIDPGLRLNCFGHLGDGNLHYNVFPPPGEHRRDWQDRAGQIKRAVHDQVDAHGGSVSAEHGIGRAKRGDLVRYGDPAKLAAMGAIKAALDPAGIMNPGALFAPEKFAEKFSALSQEIPSKAALLPGVSVGEDARSALE